MSKTNRNDPCPCGSGKKYKKCCGLVEARKPRLGAAKLLPQGSAANNPTLNLAQKVFKVLTAPSSANQAVPQQPAEGASQEAQKGYGTLEELIGIEGAPKNLQPPTP
jgi:hypothetical protein